MSSFEDRLGEMAASTVVAAAWDPLLHPRARNGQFIRVGGWVRGLFRVGADTEKVNGKVVGFSENKQHPRDPFVKVLTKHGELTTTVSKISEAVKPKGFLTKLIDKGEVPADYKKMSLDGDVSFVSNWSLEGRNLNGIPLTETAFDPHDVPDVDVGEPPLEEITTGLKQSTGVLIEEPDGRIWIYEPANHFGGYRHTFSKGRVEDEDSPQQAALREAFEELGLVVEITGYVGDYKGSVTMTRMYRGRRVGGAPWKHDNEVAEVQLVTPDTAAKRLHAERDLQILSDLTGNQSYIEEFRKVDAERKAAQKLERERKSAMKRAVEEEVARAFGVSLPKPGQQSLLERATAPQRQRTTADQMLAKWKPGL